jgi:hypothetical protein
MFGALSIALALRATSPLDLPLDERCAIVESVLAAQAKRGLSGTPKLGTVDVTFPEIEHVRRTTRRASNRTVVDVQWRDGPATGRSSRPRSRVQAAGSCWNRRRSGDTGPPRTRRETRTTWSR